MVLHGYFGSSWQKQVLTVHVLQYQCPQNNDLKVTMWYMFNF